jgi:hypothetical protein
MAGLIDRTQVLGFFLWNMPGGSPPVELDDFDEPPLDELDEPRNEKTSAGFYRSIGLPEGLSLTFAAKKNSANLFSKNSQLPISGAIRKKPNK